MTELCWQAVGLISGAGTWLPGTSPWRCVTLLGAAFGSAEVTAGTGCLVLRSLPAWEPPCLFPWLHVCALLAPGLPPSRACCAGRMGVPGLTCVEHQGKTSYLYPEGLEGAFACLGLPLLPRTSVPLPLSCLLLFLLDARVNCTGPPGASPGHESTPSLPTKDHGIWSGAFLLVPQESISHFNIFSHF